MKFAQKLKRNAVPEWIEFYLNYFILKKLLAPLKLTDKMYLKASLDGGEAEATNITPEDIALLNKFIKKFEETIMRELNKISKISIFYNLKFKDLIKRYKQIKLNAILVKRSKQKPGYDERKGMLKICFQLYYKELRLISEYISVNLEGFKKIFKKFKKMTKFFDPKNNLKAVFEEKLREMNIYYDRECIQNLISHVESEYLEIFYSRGDGRKDGQDELRKIYQGRLVSDSEFFFFGFFLGLCISFILLMFILAWVGGLSADDDSLFRTVFPVFRGIGIIILYLWLLSWNVYVWTNYNINYKLIFQFSYHYSTLSEILRRAAAFTAVFLIMFLWYILSRMEVPWLKDILNLFPRDYLPLFTWIIFIGYIFFPSNNHFNPQGRLYTFKLFKDIVASPFHPISFRVAWATDQLASFVVPLKDFEYLICFYASSNETYSECSNSTRISSAVFMALIPLLMRMIQCFRQLQDSKKYLSPPLFNALKYLSSVNVVIMSYLAGVSHRSPGYVTLWIVSAVISTAYSYYWDLKMDWGFLVKGSKNRFLRDELSYTNLGIYYGAITVNLLMRCAWVFSISPDIAERIARPELFTALIGFVEIFRRSVWNFLSDNQNERVEKEHIANCGSFKAVADYKMPYPTIEIAFDDFDLKRYLFKTELLQLMDPGADEETNNETLGRMIEEPQTQVVVNVPSTPRRPLPMMFSKSFLNMGPVDFNSLKISQDEIQEILKEVKMFKEFILQRSKVIKVKLLEERKVSQFDQLNEPFLNSHKSTLIQNRVSKFSKL